MSLSSPPNRLYDTDAMKIIQLKCKSKDCFCSLLPLCMDTSFLSGVTWLLRKRTKDGALPLAQDRALFTEQHFVQCHSFTYFHISTYCSVTHLLPPDRLFRQPIQNSIILINTVWQHGKFCQPDNKLNLTDFLLSYK